jgi:hypothetical protein
MLMCRIWLWSGYVLPMHVGISQFEQQVNVKIFFTLRKSAAEKLLWATVQLIELKLLKNLVNGLAFLHTHFY